MVLHLVEDDHSRAKRVRRVGTLPRMVTRFDLPSDHGLTVGPNGKPPSHLNGCSQGCWTTCESVGISRQRDCTLAREAGLSSAETEEDNQECPRYTGHQTDSLTSTHVCLSRHANPVRRPSRPDAANHHESCDLAMRADPQMSAGRPRLHCQKNPAAPAATMISRRTPTFSETPPPSIPPSKLLPAV